MRANRLVGAPEDGIRVRAVGDGVRETEEGGRITGKFRNNA